MSPPGPARRTAGASPALRPSRAARAPRGPRAGHTANPGSDLPEAATSSSVPSEQENDGDCYEPVHQLRRSGIVRWSSTGTHDRGHDASGLRRTPVASPVTLLTRVRDTPLHVAHDCPLESRADAANSPARLEI